MNHHLVAYRYHFAIFQNIFNRKIKIAILPLDTHAEQTIPFSKLYCQYSGKFVYVQVGRLEYKIEKSIFDGKIKTKTEWLAVVPMICSYHMAKSISIYFSSFICDQTLFFCQTLSHHFISFRLKQTSDARQTC